MWLNTSKVGYTQVNDSLKEGHSHNYVKMILSKITILLFVCPACVLAELSKGDTIYM